jgi:hypothetical protein
VDDRRVPVEIVEIGDLGKLRLRKELKDINVE